MEISKINQHVEMEIVMEAPPQEEIVKKAEEEERREEIRKKSSAEEVERMLRSIAVNENAPKTKNNREEQVQKYIDEVMAELESESSSGRYKARRDKHYKQDSLRNARDKTEQLDSLKSTFYSGKSSVSYNLKDRFARFLPIPVFKCEFGGVVVVQVSVNRKGIVQKAVVVKEQSKQDDCLLDVAVDAALRTRFNEKGNAPEIQVGTITYNFVKQ